MVDVRGLRCFVAVADARTVTAAAADLGLGQPAVSRQLQHLERQLRVVLFHRDGGRLTLTAAGRDLLVAAREALAQLDRVAASAAGLAAGRLDRVRIVATGTTSDDVVAPWLAAWAAEGPLATVVESDADALYPALRGQADLAVSPAPPPPGLDSRRVADLPVWACVPPVHPWAGRRDVPLAELAAADLLLLTPPFHARRCFDEALRRADLVADPLAEFTSPVVAQAVAASGRGVCILTDDPRFDLVPLGILDAVGAPLTIRLYAAWEPAHHAAAALALLAHDLERFVAARYAVGPAAAPRAPESRRAEPGRASRGGTIAR